MRMLSLVLVLPMLIGLHGDVLAGKAPVDVEGIWVGGTKSKLAVRGFFMDRSGGAVVVGLDSAGNWAALDQARAAKRGASNTLQQNALNAMRQVENAVINERERRERLRILVAQRDTAELTLGEARKRYLVGLTDYLNVLASLGTYQGVQLSVLQAERPG